MEPPKSAYSEQPCFFLHFFCTTPTTNKDRALSPTEPQVQEQERPEAEQEEAGDA